MSLSCVIRHLEPVERLSLLKVVPTMEECSDRLSITVMNDRTKNDIEILTYNN